MTAPLTTQWKNDMKYFVYARKSSEDVEKQALSIPTQLEKAQEIFGNLTIVDIFTETASAFKPYNRPIFTEMMERLEAGEAQGIIAWHPDRLARNEIDAGAITYFVRQGVIQDLKFCSFTFDNSPEGIMMLQMVMSQSQYFSAKLSKDVKRGVEQKVKMGWFPGPARVGYRNTPERDKGTRIIVKDTDRFDLVRKMWGLMLTGTYTVPQIVRIANEEWGFRTLKRGKIGGGPLTRSTLYDVFSSVFYAGLINFKGEIYPGKHEAMITLEEYDRVQFLLGRKGRPRPKHHRFAYTGLINCGECGCAIIAEQKMKHLKSSDETAIYTYYHCSWKRPCSQRKSVREEDLEGQIDAELSKVTILPEFREWALEVLQDSNDQEIEDRSKIHISLAKTLLQTQQQLDNLTKMRYRDLIDDEEYAHSRSELQTEITRLKEQLRDTEDRAEKWLEATERAFDFATFARHNFAVGDIQDKKEILATLGQNLTLMNGKLALDRSKWLVPIAEQYPAIEAEYDKVRTTDYPSAKTKTDAFAPVNDSWLRRSGSNRRPNG
jgi:site-specific DNA recombinase